MTHTVLSVVQQVERNMPRKNIKRDFLRDCRRNNYDDRIQYKIAFTCFHITSGTAPPYLSELLHLYSPSRSFRSASDTRIFRIPRVCRRTLGERSFQYIRPVIWNSLSFSVRHATSLSSFKSKLKIHLFSSAY